MNVVGYDGGCKGSGKGEWIYYRKQTSMILHGKWKVSQYKYAFGYMAIIPLAFNLVYKQPLCYRLLCLHLKVGFVSKFI